MAHQTRARRASSAAAFAFLIGLAASASAQELEPRAYAPLPIGTNFFVASVVHSSGDVLFDPTVPVTDVTAKSTVGIIGLGRTFDLFGRQALLVGALPFGTLSASGRVLEAAKTARRNGLTDARIKLSLILAGSGALRPAAFAKQPKRPTFGVSLMVSAPTGQYQPIYVVNLGTNRWSFKPEAGISFPFRKWTFETYGGAWFFLENPEYFPGTASKTQEPIGSVQGHVGYSFRQDVWAAFDMTWYGGGRSDVNGVKQSDFQNNSRAGLTFGIPLAKRQSLKVAYNTGATTRVGGDFDTFSVTYQLVWFDKPPSQK